MLPVADLIGGRVCDGACGSGSGSGVGVSYSGSGRRGEADGGQLDVGVDPVTVQRQRVSLSFARSDHRGRGACAISRPRSQRVWPQCCPLSVRRAGEQRSAGRQRAGKAQHLVQAMAARFLCPCVTAMVQGHVRLGKMVLDCTHGYRLSRRDRSSKDERVACTLRGHRLVMGEVKMSLGRNLEDTSRVAAHVAPRTGKVEEEDVL